MPARAMVRLAVCVALGAGLLAACGGSDGDSTATPGDQPAINFPSTLSTSPPVLSETDPAKAAPRWEQVRVATGAGATDVGPVSIAAGAIQWRVKWTCETGSLRITTTPAPTRPGPLVDGACPGSGEGFARLTGDVRLGIQASGPWKATVEQQVDTPLDEPPLPEMATAQVVGRGDFYNVEKTGKGTVILYRLGDGRQALRIEPGFEVLNDPDLVVWLSPLANPKTSQDIADAPHQEIAALKSTRGSQNYILPNDLTVPEVRTVAMFCVPVPSVYIAATVS